MEMCRVKITYLFVLVFVVFSCDKSETEVRKAFYGKWNVTGFISVESMAYPTKNGFYPNVEFKEDGSFKLNLDVNSCKGNFTLLENNQISISASGCTKMCCDSEFSNKLYQMLPQVGSYQIENNILKLEIPGWGWINLESND